MTTIRKEISMTVLPITSRKNASPARPARRRVQAGPIAPAARAAQWTQGPTGLRLRWRLSGVPSAGDAAHGYSAA
jgi:hypothetical protein